MSPAVPVLQATGLAVEVGGERLVRDLDLTLEAGGAVALRGPSGAGKSTVLRTLAGLHPFATGVLRLRGQPPEVGGWNHFRRQVALVGQTPVMLEGDVRMNLAYPFSLEVSTGAFPEARAAALLEEFDLPDAMDKPARDLSVGEAQRVHLVRSLLLDPAVLLLDEPTSALDPGRRDLVEGHLRRAREAGLALVLVTHDAVQADRLTDGAIDLLAGAS